METINIISCGIFHPSDICLLNKQKQMFEKYCKNNFKFYCVLGRKWDGEINEAYLDHVAKMIKTIESFGIPVIEPICYSLNPSTEAAFQCNFALRKVPRGKCFLVHLDSIPIDHFDLNILFNDCDIGGQKQIRAEYTYLWENLIFFNTSKIEPNEIFLEPCYINGTYLDAGGSLYYLIKNKNLKCKYYEDLFYLSGTDSILKMDFLSQNNKNLLIEIGRNKTFEKPSHTMEVYHNCFLHYRSGSNWHKKIAPWQDDIRNANIKLILQLD